MPGIGMGELLVVCVIGLFLFGKHLPNVARSLGGSVAAFRKEVRGLEEDVRVSV
jgi:TatA/E family protein of Tat protein translocase